MKKALQAAQKQKEARRDRVSFILVLILSSIAAVALLLPGIYAIAFSCGQAALGGMLWGLALMALGVLVGFLFGVPKSNRDETANGLRASTNPEDISEGNGLRANTNLEDISDWLSKIIVGTGLVELKSSPVYLKRLATLISGTLCPNGSAGMSIGAAIALVFPAIGFLIGFLVTRVWLQGEFRASDLTLVEARLEQGIEQAKNLAKIALGVAPTQIQADTDASMDVWDSDPHAGKFGGKPSGNHRQLSAEITPLLPGETTCKIKLQVTSTDPLEPLTGTVTFYLHPTYTEDQITVPVDTNGTATLIIHADAPFTVGASADNNQTRLELDLSKVPGGTREFYENA